MWQNVAQIRSKSVFAVVHQRINIQVSLIPMPAVIFELHPDVLCLL